MDTSLNARQWFRDASAGFVDLVSQVTASDLDQPGLGVWTVRDLIGHTSRSFLTIEEYLRAAPRHERLSGPGEYFRTALGAQTDPDAVAERGRQAARALGAEPTASIIALAERVRALVDASPDEASATTPWGTMTLVDYLPTRAFELTVHSLDLASATDRGVPNGITTSLGAALAVCVDIADETQARQILLALTGRAPLPETFCLL